MVVGFRKKNKSTISKSERNHVQILLCFKPQDGRNGQISLKTKETFSTIFQQAFQNGGVGKVKGRGKVRVRAGVRVRVRVRGIGPPPLSPAT